MALDERVNPDKEALVFASGRSIYAWDYGKPQCIATRPRKVESLAVYHGRLIDSGNYNGVRDTLDDKILEGPFQSWNNLTVHENRLFGTINTKNPELYGIWEISSMERVRKRNGRTIVLASMPLTLVDSGEYRKPTRGSWWEDQEDPDLYDTIKNESVLKRISGDMFRAGLKFKGDVLVATDTEIFNVGKLGETRTYTQFYSLESDIFELFREFSKPDIAYGYANADRRKIWEEFRKLFSENADALPKDFRFLREEQYDGRKSKGVEIKPLHFEEACREYNWNFPRFQSAFPGKPVMEGLYLSPILAHAALFLLSYHNQQNRIQAMAEVNDMVVVGGKSRRIEIADLEMQKTGGNILCDDFRHPISAMVAVPTEFYKEGIRQEVLRRIRNKAYYAKSPEMIQRHGKAA